MLHLLNDSFYPTPRSLASKMIAKIRIHPSNILEPSAGRGDIIDALFDHRDYKHRNIFAIEKDQSLRAILRGKDIKVIDSDFLEFSGPDKFDLIIANPPFADGDLHLLKAIDILYTGQIIFLLNSETLKNPCTNRRKDLIRRLEELNAEIEYHQGEFLQAERRTKVEVVLVNIVIERNISDDLFTNMGDKAKDYTGTVREKYEVATGKSILDMVAEYNEVMRTASETIIGYYRNYRKIGGFIGLNCDPEKHSYSTDDLTRKVQETVNNTARLIRKSFWRRAMELEEIKSRLTNARRKEFDHQIETRCDMEFTENNIRSFILNVIGSYNDTMTRAVLEIFDKMTIRHCYDDNLRNENIHLYNGWKTNKAYKVGKRVVIPIRVGWDGPFRKWGKWELDWDTPPASLTISIS